MTDKTKTMDVDKLYFNIRVGWTEQEMADRHNRAISYLNSRGALPGWFKPFYPREGYAHGSFVVMK